MDRQIRASSFQTKDATDSPWRGSRLGSLLCVVFFITVFLSGCSPFYILRAAYEEGKILWARRPIEELLRRGDLDRDRREKLETVLALRRFAKDRLKLNVDGSYSSYARLDRSFLSYILMAVPQTDLRPYTWWFLFVGRVPYKGFFSQEDARAEAASFQAQGYDTYIRPVSAFSTLGWFDDPLLDHLLKYDTVTLVEVILHELLHGTLFVSGAVDFNESLANFVGLRGAIEFTLERYGERSPEHLQAIRKWEEELEFSKLINEMARSLRDLYRRDLPREEKLRLRKEIFTRGREEWASRTVTRPTHRYRDFSRQEINNAVIVHYLLYLGGLDLFESLYQAEGRDLARLVKSIEGAVQDSEEPFQAVRDILGRGRPGD